MKKILIAVLMAASAGAAYAGAGETAVGQLGLNDVELKTTAPEPEGVVYVGAGESAAEQAGVNDIEMRTTYPEPGSGPHFLIPTRCRHTLDVTGPGGLPGAVKRAKQIFAGQGVNVSHVAIVTGPDIAYLTISAEAESKTKVFEESNAPVTLGEDATQKRMENKINELLESGAVITACSVFEEPRYGNSSLFLPYPLIPQRRFFRVEYIK
jgi:hypothetical protein